MWNDRLRRTGLLAGALAFGPLLGCGGEGEATQQEAATAEVATNVRTLTLAPTSLNEYLNISGPLEPIHGTDVSTEESGVVRSIPREKGAPVGRGDTLIELKRDVLQAEMRAAKARRDLAEYNEEQTKLLFDEEQVSRQEMLQVETEHAEAVARAEVAELRWRRAAVKAPFDGILADRYVEPGELVVAGTPVARVIDPYTLKLSASVSEREVAWIRPGATAAVSVNGRREAYEGCVQWVSFEADPVNGKFQVEVLVDNPDLGLRPGVVARAEVLKVVHENVVVIPRDAVVLLPEGPTVMVVEESRARQRTVELGSDQGLMTIVNDGVSPGDRIIVRGQRDVFDGSLVEVRQEATAPDGSTSSDPHEVRAAEAFAPVQAVRPQEIPPAPDATEES